MSEENDNKESSKDSKDSLDLKWIFLTCVCFIFVALLWFKVIKPALEPADHSPTSVIEQSKDGDYLDEFFGE